MYTQSINKEKNMNYWKTSDIKISTDSAGYMTAKHTYAGLLIDSSFYTDRAECRRDAVEGLKEMKDIQDWKLKLSVECVSGPDQ
tara:strand:+ start:1459 stop:1710 length:252 start_codon:yes stop_codon:yes gene_type:complete